VNAYSIALFFHVMGAILLFVGLGVLILATIAIRRVRRVEPLRSLIGPLTAGRQIAFEHISLVDLLVVAGVLLIALSALYMVPNAWSFDVPWIRVAIASTLLIAPLGPAVVDPRLHAIARASADLPDGPLDARVIARTHDPALTIALDVMASTLVGVVFLMTNKPPVLESVAAVAVAASVGIAIGVAAVSRARPPGA
jgi:hypothetical protein